jgi:hypothetical protein
VPKVKKAKKLTQEYWEKRLRQAGLSMDAGRKHSDGVNTLIYVGGSGDVEGLEEQLVRERCGRVVPKGHGPDDGANVIIPERFNTQ